ncbi:centrosomal protein of 57 kDa [Sinocyclocheilus anshuiensis]|uniref:Centrosomal protein of 57 kDa-like n=1 Tax=Sinocyclocheilus anshuiensis TaxID=1608454 RepID=A0A671S4L5_9TELE|nr:PREDICTED: centrosomal protein of 57 kDa-like [Sinocyclocheilus anshuiensis]XP_016333770.1 PREDICTED: centrosomal protein of 57 kDa-like [Sinocyclocheilus anshuiensis]
MDSSSKPSAGREKEGVTEPLRGRPMSDSVSLASYSEYPAGRPFINTPLPFTNRAVKAFPESSGAAILSALKNLQEKIRHLELERCDAQQKLQTISRESTHSDHRHTNHDLLSQLSAAETRCSRLEKQLEHMRKTVRNTESDRSAVLRRQVSLERLGSADWADVQLKLQKLDLLEQEYYRLTETQSAAERKIRQLERKLQEEEHQRKLVQDKAAQLQTGLEANRLLIQSVSPRPHKSSRIKPKKLSAKKHPSQSQPHYRLSLGDVPFVTGTSTGSSHSVRANVQHVLHLMKQHHPQLCNERVLGHAPSTNHSSSSSSSSSCGEELSELLLTLQDEFGHMNFEQQELAKRIQSCGSDRLRRDLEREMETLVKRMENKAEQIAKVRRHQTQCVQQSDGGGQMKVWSRSVKARPGERSRDSLRLLKDMRSLQTSLRSWEY